eukprot:sb/3460891/
MDDFLVFQFWDPHRSTMQVENLCYVSVHYMAPIPNLLASLFASFTFASFTTINDVKMTEKDKENQQRFKGLLLHIFFLVTLSIVVCGTVSPYQFYYTRSIESLFIDGSTVDTPWPEVDTWDSLWSYLNGAFLDGIYDNSVDDQEIYVYNENKLLSLPRIRQLKVTNSSCQIPSVFGSSLYNCYSGYHPDDESSRTLPFEYVYSDQGTSGSSRLYNPRLETRPYSGYLTSYSRAGYQQLLTRNKVVSSFILSDLQYNGWVDRGTRVMFIDFTVYNVNINMFAVVKLVAEFLPTGGVMTSYDVLVQKFLRYVTPWDKVIFGFEIVLILFVIYFLVEEGMELCIFRMRYFMDVWNILDTIIIVQILVGELRHNKGFPLALYSYGGPRIETPKNRPFLALSSPRLEWTIFLVFLGPHGVKCKWKTFVMSQVSWKNRHDVSMTEKDKENQQRFKGLLLHIFFLVTLSIVVCGTVSPYQFYYTRSIESLFIDGSTVDTPWPEVDTWDSLWSYLNGAFLDGIYDNSVDDQEIYVYNENKLLSLPRIRQLKVTNSSCQIPSVFGSSLYNCYSGYHPDDESSRTLPFEYVYSDQGTSGSSRLYNPRLQTRPYSGYLTSYSRAGYQQLLTRNKVVSSFILSDLQYNGWVDRGTRAMFIDFTVYNVNINMFAVVKLVAEFLPTGGVMTSYDVLVQKFLRYVTPWDKVIFGFEIVLILFVIYFLVEEGMELCIFRMRYFMDVWNILDTIIIVQILVGFGISLYRTMTIEGEYHLRLRLHLCKCSKLFIAFYEMIYNDNAAICLFLTWMKVFKFINVTKTMRYFSTTLSRCCKDILSFSLMFLIVFFAFAQLGQLLFGTDPLKLKDRNLARSLEDGPIFFISYIFLVFFILLNMFLAIINDTYSAVKVELDSEVQVTEFGEYVKRRITGLFSCCKKRSKEVEEGEEDDPEKAPAEIILPEDEAMRAPRIDDEDSVDSMFEDSENRPAGRNLRTQETMSSYPPWDMQSNAGMMMDRIPSHLRGPTYEEFKILSRRMLFWASWSCWKGIITEREEGCILWWRRVLRYVTPWDKVIFGFEIVLILFVIYFLVEEGMELCIFRMRYFMDVWNILDTIIIVQILVGFGISLYRTMTIEGLIVDSEADVDTFTSFENIAFYEMIYNDNAAICLFLTWMKVFKFINVTKTMRYFSTTLSRCCKDILSFSLMFLIVFFAFAQLGQLLFGTVNRDFSSFLDSTYTLFRIILGDFDFLALERARNLLGPIFFISYIFLVFFILLNMFLAIINDTYSAVKVELDSEVQVTEFGEYVKRRITGLFSCCKKRSKEVEEGEEDDPEKAPAEIILPEDEAMRAPRIDDEDSVDSMFEDSENRPAGRNLRTQETMSSYPPWDMQSNAGMMMDRIPSHLRGPTYEEFKILSRRVDRNDDAMGSVISKIDAVLGKLELLERNYNGTGGGMYPVVEEGGDFPDSFEDEQTIHIPDETNRSDGWT